MARLEALRDRHKGEDIIVFGNGPSLNSFDPALIQGRTTIGSNGIYEAFSKWGRTTDYLIIEDVEQAEKRGRAFRDIDGPLKLAALYNAHGIPRPWGDDLIFYNARYACSDAYFGDWGPHFSKDFSGCVWLGNTVTFISLQLAWHLGAARVFLVGVDFNYGPLEAAYQPGKLKITEENIDLVRQCHFTPDYYRLGDTIGVPNTGFQKRAYDLARQTFEADGRDIINVSDFTKLDSFKRAPLSILKTDQAPA
ncbi:MAG: hypothetical protein AAGF20_12185 [Pseudomonadota bacterium]